MPVAAAQTATQGAAVRDPLHQISALLDLALTQPKENHVMRLYEIAGADPFWDPAGIKSPTMATGKDRVGVLGKAGSLTDIAELLIRLRRLPMAYHGKRRPDPWIFAEVHRDAKLVWRFRLERPVPHSGKVAPPVRTTTGFPDDPVFPYVWPQKDPAKRAAWLKDHSILADRLGKSIGKDDKDQTDPQVAVELFVSLATAFTKGHVPGMLDGWTRTGWEMLWKAWGVDPGGVPPLHEPPSGDSGRKRWLERGHKKGGALLTRVTLGLTGFDAHLDNEKHLVAGPGTGSVRQELDKAFANWLEDKLAKCTDENCSAASLTRAVTSAGSGALWKLASEPQPVQWLRRLEQAVVNLEAQGKTVLLMARWAPAVEVEDSFSLDSLLIGMEADLETANAFMFELSSVARPGPRCPLNLPGGFTWESSADAGVPGNASIRIAIPRVPAD